MKRLDAVQKRLKALEEEATKDSEVNQFLWSKLDNLEARLDGLRSDLLQGGRK